MTNTSGVGFLFPSYIHFRHWLFYTSFTLITGFLVPSSFVPSSLYTNTILNTLLILRPVVPRPSSCRPVIPSSHRSMQLLTTLIYHIIMHPSLCSTILTLFVNILKFLNGTYTSLLTLILVLSVHISHLSHNLTPLSKLSHFTVNIKSPITY